jgi:hypothetical protein
VRDGKGAPGFRTRSRKADRKEAPASRESAEPGPEGLAPNGAEGLGKARLQGRAGEGPDGIAKLRQTRNRERRKGASATGTDLERQDRRKLRLPERRPDRTGGLARRRRRDAERACSRSGPIRRKEASASGYRAFGRRRAWPCRSGDGKRCVRLSSRRP